MALSDVKLKFSLDSSGVTKTLNSTKASIKNFASSAVSSFGLVAGAAGFGAMSNAAIDLGSRISDMALQLNIGTDELQVLEHAARISGVQNLRCGNWDLRAGAAQCAIKDTGSSKWQ